MSFFEIIVCKGCKKEVVTADHYNNCYQWHLYHTLRAKRKNDRKTTNTNDDE